MGKRVKWVGAFSEPEAFQTGDRSGILWSDFKFDPRVI
jgi:hypothetical protein